jgi:tetratricopeptide (TPR) repeat protein
VSQSNPIRNRPSLSSAGQDIPPDDHESIPLTEAVDRLVAQGVETARAGRRREAIKLFDQALAIDEDHVEALLWRGGLSEANESLPFLEHAAALSPGNQRAREGLHWARQRVGLAPRPAAALPPRPTPQQPPLSAARPAQPVQQQRPSANIPRPAQPVPAAVIARPVAPAGSVATASSIPLARPQAPALDIVGILGGALSFLVKHPTIALIIAVMLLGMLGTAAVARAGLSKNQPAPLPTPVVISSTSSANSAGSAAPSSPASALPAASRPVSATLPTATPRAASLDQAWSASDWPLAILMLDEMLRRTPGDATLTKKLFTARYNYGVQLVRSEKLAEAVAEFDKALAISPNDADALGERRFAQAYLEGSTALARGDFYSAITPLRTIYDGNPAYRSVKARLYQAYAGYADALEKEGKRADAYLVYQKASHIDAQGQEAQVGMARLKDAAPADQVAAAAAKKKIEIDIAKQQVIVWENNKVIYRFKASTGKAPYVTRTGEFEILNKMPNAYSSAMEWGMPYWMGIYQAGGSENGFHAMARLTNGTVLSTSVLGRPATRGCIMLSDADARTLYNWAAVGIPVTIATTSARDKSRDVRSHQALDVSF